MKNKTKLLLFAVTILAFVIGLFLPMILLNINAINSTKESKKAPSEYYAGANSVVSKTVSAQLSEHEKASIIAGIIDSETIEVSNDLADHNEYEAVLMAQTSIEEYYNAGLYPTSLASDYGNWYSWETVLYQATDSTFHTYTVYYWLIRFVKYDSSETHTILITDAGDILAAYMESESNIHFKSDVKTAFFNYYNEKTPSVKMSYEEMNIADQGEAIYPVMPPYDLSFRSIYLLAEGSDSLESTNIDTMLDDPRVSLYYVSTLNASHHYVFTKYPYYETDEIN